MTTTTDTSNTDTSNYGFDGYGGRVGYRSTYDGTPGKPAIAVVEANPTVTEGPGVSVRWNRMNYLIMNLDAAEKLLFELESVIAGIRYNEAQGRH